MSWARRRTEPVATVAPGGRSASAAPTNASRGSRRSQKAASSSPSASAEGRSLALCAARSADPSSTARCTSFTNTPWPPMVCNGTSVRWSPSVSTNTNCTRRPGCAAINASATAVACAFACALPLVASRSVCEAVVISSGRRGRARRQRCARPAGCLRRPSASPTSGAAAWRRCPW